MIASGTASRFAGGAGQSAPECDPKANLRGYCSQEMVRKYPTREAGQGMVEYALILVLVSIVVIVILLTMGGQVKNMFSNIQVALGA